MKLHFAIMSVLVLSAIWLHNYLPKKKAKRLQKEMDDEDIFRNFK